MSDAVTAWLLIPLMLRLEHMGTVCLKLSGATVGIVFFVEPATALKAAGIAFVVVSIALLNLEGAH